MGILELFFTSSCKDPEQIVEHTIKLRDWNHASVYMKLCKILELNGVYSPRICLMGDFIEITVKRPAKDLYKLHTIWDSLDKTDLSNSFNKLIRHTQLTEESRIN